MQCIRLISSDLVGITNTATSITAAGLILVATWYHTYTVKKLARVEGQKETVETLLLRDGKHMSFSICPKMVYL